LLYYTYLGSTWNWFFHFFIFSFFRSTEFLLKIIQNKTNKLIVESSLRAILSLTYVDIVSLWLGNEIDINNDNNNNNSNNNNYNNDNNNYIALFISFLRTPFYSRDSLRISLEILCNLCVHVSNKTLILKYCGIEALVSLQCDDDGHVRDLSFQILGTFCSYIHIYFCIHIYICICMHALVLLQCDDDGIAYHIFIIQNIECLLWYYLIRDFSFIWIRSFEGQHPGRSTRPH
jgi:hypothetical protein